MESSALGNILDSEERRNFGKGTSLFQFNGDKNTTHDTKYACKFYGKNDFPISTGY